MIARMMRDLPADYLSICVGINVYGAASLGPRTFIPSILGFVRILRERHPTTPLAVISPIYSPSRETTENAVGFTLRAMRAEVAEAVDLLQSQGDQHVHYVDGLRLFGPELAHLLPDGLHPNAEGYEAMGESFLREVAGPLFR
jgi:lysophospholipase L1-like esterase